MAYSVNVIDRADEVAAHLAGIDPASLTAGVDRLTLAYVQAVMQALPPETGVVVQVTTSAKGVSVVMRRAGIGARTPYAL